MAGEATVGSILGYLRLDRSDWDAELNAAGAKADELGRHNPNIRIGTNAPSAIAQLSAVAAATKRLQDAQGAEAVAEARLQSLRDRGVTDAGRLAAAEEAVTKARRSQAAAVIALAAAQDTEHAASTRATADANKVSTAADHAKGSVVSLWDALLLAPAAVPILGVASGAMIGLLPVAATVMLAVKGIENQMKAGALQGTQFAASVNALKGELTTLETTAAGGIVTGVNKALAASGPLFKTVNQDVGIMSAQLGNIVGGAAPALLHLLIALNPLFVTFGDLLTRGAGELDNWAKNSTGVQSFVAYVQAQLPTVMSFLGNLIVLVSHLVQGMAPFGSSLLYSLNAFVHVLNMIPVDVLQRATPIVISLYVALKALTLLTPGVNSIGGALKALGTTMDLTGARTSAMVAQQEAASMAITAAAARQAAGVAEAEAEKAAAAADAAVEIAAAEESNVASLDLSASAAAEDAITFAAAMREKALAATAAADTISADAAAAAEASTAAGEAASVGWGAMLGPVGAAVAGLGILGMSLFHTGQSAQQMQMEVNSLTDAIKQDSGAVGENTKAYIVNALQKSGALDDARQLGLSLQDVTAAAMGNTAAMNLIQMATLQYQYGVVGATKDTSKQTAAARDLLSILGDQSSAVGKAKTAYDNEQAAMGAATAATNTQANAAQQLATAINTANTALQKFYDTELSNAATQDQFLIGLKQIGQNIKQNGTSLSQNTLNGLQNRQMLIQLLQAAESAAKTSKDYTGALEGNVAQLEQAAIHAGMSKTAVQQLIAQMHLTPKDIETRFNADITPAQRALIALNNYIATHTPHVTVEVSASGTKGEYIPGMGYVIQHMASGGAVTGPGAKGVDSQPRLLAPGEFVMNNRAVDKYGLGFMRALNAGTLTLPAAPVAAAPAAGAAAAGPAVFHLYDVNGVLLGTMRGEAQAAGAEEARSYRRQGARYGAGGW